MRNCRVTVCSCRADAQAGSAVKKTTQAAPVSWCRRQDQKVIDSIRSELDIQAVLDSIPYSADPVYRCPRSVLRDRKANCFDGALFAAAALLHLGRPPLIMELKAVRDDDHLLAVFRRHGCWGAIAKSNCAGLRYREPIYRNIRELALSYFEFYFNVESEKTLRGYSSPIDLAALDPDDWRVRDEAMERIEHRIDRSRHYALVTPAMIKTLGKTDDRTYAAGMLGADDRGLYKPGPA